MTVATWNVDGKQLENIDLSPWIFPFANSLDTPEIIVIGLQNTGKKSSGMFAKNAVDTSFWTN